MSQALELLNSLAETMVDHSHPVPDSDKHFIINPFTRQIEADRYSKTVIMRGDHNSERFTFEIPRYVDGHDMSLCNRVAVHYDNVGATIEEVHHDLDYMTDIHLDPENADAVVCSWLIRREATQIVGILSFSLKYQCVEEDETITYEWNTDSYDEVEVRNSKNNGDAAIIPYTSVLEQWRSQIFGAGDSVMANITAEGANQIAAVAAEGASRLNAVTTEGESKLAAITTEGVNQVSAVQTESATQQAAIELKGSETLASIPEDYTEVYNMANEAMRTKADGVVCEAEGEVITITDASDDHIRGLNLYGKSTQFTTTGKNKVDLSDYEFDDSNYTHMLYPTSDSAMSLYEFLRANTGRNIMLSMTITGTPSGVDIGSIRFYGAGDELLCALIPGVMHTVKEIPESFTASYIYGSVTGASVKNLQIEFGETVTDYEPYTGGLPSPNPDYPQEIKSIENPVINVYGEKYSEPQPLTVTHTLSGIAVTSGGNYTDSNGQQWICDEIDFERRVYIQRIGNIIVDNSMTYFYNTDNFFLHTGGNLFDNVAAWETRILSTHFVAIGNGIGMGDYGWFQFNGNGGIRFRIEGIDTVASLTAWLDENHVEVIYPLATPIETPLTAEEIDTYKALRTNYPNTTVLNDAGAMMKVKYNADTKLYIDSTAVNGAASAIEEVLNDTY